MSNDDDLVQVWPCMHFFARRSEVAALREAHPDLMHYAERRRQEMAEWAKRIDFSRFPALPEKPPTA